MNTGPRYASLAEAALMSDSLAVMDADEKRRRASSFGAVADKYAEHRPDYPTEAVSWLVGTSPGRVLELGAGTGKLTAAIVALGHEVVATDPSAEMLTQLKQVAPTAYRAVGRAENIPLPSSSVDIAVAAQAFHWFDQDRALPEIARVLRPGGTLALVWNNADLTVPWVKKVYRLIDMLHDDVGDDPVEGSELFTTSEQHVVRHWQQFHRDSLIGFVGSQSRVAGMTPAEREALLEEIGNIYDSYGRGPDGMLMPWNTYCYRARVTGLASVHREPEEDLDDGLLIDFN